MIARPSAMAAVLRDFRTDPEIARVPTQSPAPGQVAIRVGAAAVSFVDALTAVGKYQLRPELPWIPGSECAGIVQDVGEGVQCWHKGDRVCAMAWGGMYAEMLYVDQSAVARLPDGMDVESGAVVRVAYITALHGLQDRARLQPGERLLVLGASGSTGQAAVEIGKALGAEVVAAASSEAKRARLLEYGADHAVNSSPDALRQDVEARFGKAAIDIVFDPVGGEASTSSFRLLRWGGRHCVIGFSAGTIPNLALNWPLLQGAAVVGVNVGRFFDLSPHEAAERLNQVFGLYQAGRIRARVTHRFALEDVSEALRLARSGTAAGRIILLPTQSEVAA